MVSPSTDRRFGLNPGIAIKAPCKLATTANITLSDEQSIDGTTTDETRVVVKDQTDTTKNGIYLSGDGAWVREADSNGNRDLVGGTIVYVTSGTVNSDEFFKIAGAGTITVDTDSIVWLSTEALGFDNTTEYELGSSAVAASHTGIITGHIIRTNYRTSSRIAGSGSEVAFTGTTTVARNSGLIANWPYTDGYFYDSDGKQFDVIDHPKLITQFGAATANTAAANNLAIQAALTSAIAKGRHVHIPEGAFSFGDSGTGILISIADGSRINGFKLTGEAFKASELVWEGGTSGSMFIIQNVRNPVLEDFYIRGSNVPDAGIHLRATTNSSGGRAVFTNVTIDSAKIGLQVGDTDTGTYNNSLPGCSYRNLEVTNCTTASVAIYGNNSDGQHFYNLRTSNSPITILTSAGRNITVNGGGHSNPTATSEGYPAFYYFQADNDIGTLGGGPYSFKGIRIEGGVGLCKVGPTTSDASNGICNVEFADIVHASIPTDISATPQLVHWAQNGNLTLNRCQLIADNNEMLFYQIGRTNRHVTLTLNDCIFSDTPSDPFTYGNLITVSGSGGGGTTGGLRVFINGCKSEDFSTVATIAHFENQDLTVFPVDADNSVFRESDNGLTHQRSTTLTTSQVNNCRATPIELVPTPGAGKLLEFVSAVLFYNYTTTAFTVGADEDFVIQYDGSTDVTASIESTGFIDQTNDEIRLIEPTWTATTDMVALVNKKLEIFNTGAGETADGGTSTLKVTVTYRIHSTGL